MTMKGNRQETYGYDLSGNLTTFLDRKQQQTTFAYDALNRRTKSIYPDASTTVTYDAVGLGYDSTNRRISLSYPNRTSTGYTYDVVSRVTDILHEGHVARVNP